MNFSWLSWSNPVALWWVFLICVSFLNIVTWLWTRRYIKDSYNKKQFHERFFFPRVVLALSGGYVFGCAFRSVLPRADVQRICLFDTWFSSVFIGRSIATIAELCFILQWAVALRFLARKMNAKWAKKIALVIVPIIVVAECCSWFAVVTTNYIGNSIEESLWALTYILIFTALLDLWPRFKGSFKYAVGLAALGCLAYVAFMATVDVPMYLGRLKADHVDGKVFLGFFEGIKDLNTRWIVTHDIYQWKTEIPWMTLYFAGAVWVSLAMCYVPFSVERLKKYKVIRSG